MSGSQAPGGKAPFPWQKTELLGIKQLTKSLLKDKLEITDDIKWEQLDLQVLSPPLYI